MLFKIKQEKQNKKGFKQEHTMRYSTQNPIQKTFDSGKTFGESVALSSMANEALIAKHYRNYNWLSLIMACHG